MARFNSTATPCTTRRAFPTTPFLGISDRGVIVLFYSHDGAMGHGVVLHPGQGSFAVGHRSQDWTMSRFQPYTGSVTVTTAD